MERGREKEIEAKRDADGKRGGAREKDDQVGRRGSLQKDTKGQRGIRPTGRATRARTNKGNV